MKTINLYFDFEFTSLSPDAQPISVGIVSDEIDFVHAEIGDINFHVKKHELFEGKPKSISFYAEFSDFDLNRCDDWVKEHVVGKLHLEKGDAIREDNRWEAKSHFSFIGDVLEEWLNQFKSYQIQFVSDCGTWDWYWMVQLLAKWDEKEIDNWIQKGGWIAIGEKVTIKTGLPKLPENISPVPFDLNDLIAIKKGITPALAFDLDRELLAFGRSFPSPMLIVDLSKLTEQEIEDIANEYRKIGDKILPLNHCTEIKPMQSPKHNSLFDAIVIKECYNNLK